MISENVNNDISENNNCAKQLENLYVHQVYEAIAPDFSSTRHSPWPSVAHFLKEQTGLGVDIGCGNGKYMISNRLPIIGLERSNNLAQIVYGRNLPIAVGDILNIPFCSDRFDFFICIAVIHHLSTLERRVQAVRELARILCVGGKGLIQVWAKEQFGMDGASPSYYVRTKSDKSPEILDQSSSCHKKIEVVPGVVLPVHIPKTEFIAQDMLVPWKIKNIQKQTESTDDPLSTASIIDERKTRGRFYHLFVKDELNSLVEKVSSLKIEDSFYEQGNWVIRVRKIA